MTNPWKAMWDARFSKPEYAYGTTPNVFFKSQLQLLPPGDILFGAEGEGRNAVFAGCCGWTVSAFDISVAGKMKAKALAEASGVTVDYRVGVLPELEFKSKQFDVIALIYAHFPTEIREDYHRLLDEYLKPGGTVIIEAFGSRHPEYQQRYENIGGPKDPDLLFSEAMMRSDFKAYTVIELEEKPVALNEGYCHIGVGSVLRFVGRKP